jgi:hypothetical protein
MTEKGQSKEKAPKTCRECKHWERVREKIRVHELLERTIERFETKIMETKYEPTVAEFVKLLQLEREMGQEDEPKEIKVTWVGPNEMSDSVK